MRRRTKGVLYLLGFIGFLIGLLVVRPAWQARRPLDMPRNSVWIDAPALPFSFYHGWWFGCWIDSDGRSNRCRLWGSGGLQTVYEGLYVSCDSKAPVQGNELQLSAPLSFEDDELEPPSRYDKGPALPPAEPGPATDRSRR